jgi:hypothetical protein
MCHGAPRHGDWSLACMVDDGVPFSHGLMWGGGDAARYQHRPDSMRLFFNAW